MIADERANPASAALRLALRVHDASAGLAIGIGLLKGWAETAPSERHRDSQLVIEVFEQVLADLRQMSRAIPDGGVARPRPANVRESLERAASTAGVELELKVIGRSDWLTEGQLELVRLAGREAIRNVKRHSGASHCRITLDVSTCPFVLTARDWGAGTNPGALDGGGITLLDALARQEGASIAMSSQPGFGVELVLTGPRCVLSRSDDGPDRLRSVVADESAGSRKRVAARRPLGASEQQIT